MKKLENFTEKKINLKNNFGGTFGDNSPTMQYAGTSHTGGSWAKFERGVGWTYSEDTVFMDHYTSDEGSYF